MNRLQKKSVQTLNYLASKSSDGLINRLKLIKMLWLADKYHLLKYGRTILKDSYYALEHGPVPSETMDISKTQSSDYVNEFISNSRLLVKSVKTPDITYFSQSDMEVLDLVWEKFGHLNHWNLRDLSHEYPEWKKFEDEINNPFSPNSFPMDLHDFYDIPEATELNMADFFNIPEEMILESKETFALRQKFER
ncbi:MAG: SocA family protein [Bacteroidia bacterium]|nr:SocA family protein [Bacteroidia bacterium]